MLGVIWVVGSLTIIVFSAVLFGVYRWDTKTREIRARLEAARLPLRPRTVDFRQLEDLPAPVARYFRKVLKDGQPIVAGARIRHRGTFNMGDETDRWKPFTSDQQVVTRRPGFDWNARVVMTPGLSAYVHDAYVAGEGLLHASVLGLFSVVDIRGTRAIAEGELMRFLAEAAWYPTALLPSQDMQWQPVDDHSAHAKLTDGCISVSLLFKFNASGTIDTVRAEARGRLVDDENVPTPWGGRFSNYEQRNGMLMPLDGEVSWILPEGARPYWRGRIREIEHQFTSEPS